MPIPFAAFDHTKAIDKNGAPYRVYGLWGDAFLQDEALKLILELSLDPDARDFNMDVLDGETTKITDVLATAANYPFLSDRRVVVVKRAEKMEGLARGEDSGKKKSSKSGQSPAQQLTAGIKNLPETTVLVLQRTPETPDIGEKPGERCINANIDKAIDDGTKGSIGLLVNCVVPSKNTAYAAGIIEFQARARGILMARGASAYLVERCGTDIAFLIGELEKCALSAGIGTPVTPAIINEMTLPQLQDTIWDLMDFIGSKQGGKAISALRELYERGEAPERIMVNIVSLLRQLLQARTFLDMNLPLNASLTKMIPAHIAAQLPSEYKDNLAMQLPSQSWKAPKLAAQAKRFTVPQLQRALELAFEADLASKGIEGDGGFESKEASSAGLEILVAKLCAT
jgi:DNA polymerase-3 subunit delta